MPKRNTRMAHARGQALLRLVFDERRVEPAEIEGRSVAMYIKQFGTKASNRTVKQYLAAIRRLFDYFEHGWHPGGQSGSLARNLSRHPPAWYDG
jgi:hypothetical protein